MVKIAGVLLVFTVKIAALLLVFMVEIATTGSKI